MNILIVEDDDRIADFLVRGLRAEGHHIQRAADGPAGLALARDAARDLAQQPPADGAATVLLLDLMLPGIGGLEICQTLRAEQVDLPILMLTAQGALEDRVAGLRLGADDYLCKPFAFEELLARAEALLRRPRAMASPQLKVGDLEVDLGTREVHRAGTQIELTPKEFAVLEYLMRHAGRVMSRTLITEYAWGYHFDPGTNIVDVVINHLRKKIDAPHEKKLITTVRGVGYMIRA